VDKLGTVEIDRCPSHGTWFDQHELGQALVETVEPKASTGVGGWLKRLFT
jgi:Zn-finger nucleic acid-binding protein